MEEKIRKILEDAYLEACEDVRAKRAAAPKNGSISIADTVADTLALERKNTVLNLYAKVFPYESLCRLIEAGNGTEKAKAAG